MVDPQGVHDHLVQGADRGGAGARLPLADQARAARARDDRRLRPLALRGRARRPGPQPGRAADVAAPLRARSTGSRTAWSRDGTTVVKCFLHISKDESAGPPARPAGRPDKHWKFNPGDIDEPGRVGPAYQEAYSDALERCTTEAAPWYVVPADRKWYRNWAIIEHPGRAARGDGGRLAGAGVRRRGAAPAPERRRLNGVERGLNRLNSRSRLPIYP